MNNFDYKNLTPFKWFVLENFPFIENDFDAINNYHLFSKVVEYLNNTIDSMNLTGEQMENVTNAMTNLQDYVNNYFENLDVQTEINNKLDAMATDGTLYNIMLPYFSAINVQLNNINNKVDAVTNGSPIPASSISEMTDTSKIYVNTTNGHKYYYDGTQWVDFGVYQATEVEYTKNQFYENNIGYINNDNTKCNIFTNINTTINAFINNDGTIQTVDNFSLSDYLPINPNSHLITNLLESNTVSYGFYDLNKNFISRTVNQNNVDTPANAYYLRISCATSRYKSLLIFENQSLPSIYYPYTPFIRDIPIIKNISKAKLLRGGIIISELSNDNTMTITVLPNTIIYSENYFVILNEATYLLPINKAIFVNCLTGNLEIQNFNQNTINHTTYYNDMLFLGFNNNGIIYTYDYELNTAIVNKNGFMTYAKITDAGKKLSANGTIKIHEGEYDEILEFWNKKINLIGIGNKRNIVIFNTNGNYPTPPLEFACGTIKNLTIYSKFNGNYPTDEWASYAMHVESNNLANEKLICENVIFKTDFNYCVGIGTRKNCYIEFNNCEFISNTNSQDTNISTKGGGLFIHDPDDSEYWGTSNIIIKNCYFENVSMHYNIRLMRIHSENVMNFTFIDNTFWSKLYEGQDVINNQNNALENWNITYASHGNNINVLNKS